ncbi:bisanhydrobacterioruberin hydratase [Halococcoides cellulosivorans]|uniref:Carotene biosynthesis protein n=1 Tax=Halococcoides cellulosivorans TaxID=1679096 RepID=A0A2R4WZS5_9EURY|nr:bisanhydrobacterioruberin hydratase [Halococcoides cellulosivorans]AWB27031.1 carotene biosynthesis protein [Halococcoides cellulosivorans]
MIDRRRVERALDRGVAANRFTIAITFPAVGAVMLVASAEGWLGAVHPALAFNPWLLVVGTAVMRLPLIAGVLPLLDRRGTAAVLALTAYTYAIEFVGVLTGLPYGPFEYTIDLGPMIAGTVPAALPIFFFPLVLNAYLLAVLLLGRRAGRAWIRLPAVVLTVLAMDVVLDPGAVGLGFWAYGSSTTGGLWGALVGTLFYGVPLSNYAGWVLSASVGVLAFDLGFSRTDLLDRLESTGFMLDDLVSFVILWGAINAWFGNWIAVAVAGAFGVGLLWTDRFDFDIRETVPLVGADPTPTDAASTGESVASNEQRASARDSRQ